MNLEKKDIIAILKNRARDNGKVIRDFDFEAVADDIIQAGIDRHLEAARITTRSVCREMCAFCKGTGTAPNESTIAFCKECRGLGFVMGNWQKSFEEALFIPNPKPTA